MSGSVMYNPEFVRRVLAKRKQARIEAARKESELLVTEWRKNRAVEIASLKNDFVEQATAIIEKVAAAFNLGLADILEHSRKQKVFNARVEAILAVKRTLPEISLPLMGQAFNRDHTSILSVLRRYGGLGNPPKPRKDATKRLTIRVSDQYRSYLGEMAEECGVPIASLVRSLVQAVVDDERANNQGRFLRAVK